MRMLGLSFGCCCLLLGCGNGSTGGNDASLDAPADSMPKDATTGADASADAPNDGAPNDAATDAACGLMCRLYSQYCNTAPCTCLSLASTEPDPTCDAGTVSCTIDPCAGKTAVCTPSGCVVQ